MDISELYCFCDCSLWHWSKFCQIGTVRMKLMTMLQISKIEGYVWSSYNPYLAVTSLPIFSTLLISMDDSACT